MVTTHFLFTTTNDADLFSPNCRAKVIGKKKNVVINGILEAYFKAYPHKRPALQAIDNIKAKPKTSINANNAVGTQK